MTTRYLFPPDPGRVAVKICGVTRGDEAAAIIAEGADAIGINFWPGSRRFLPLAEASSWLRDLAGTVPRVAVTVNASDEELQRLHDSGVIDWIQLHGDESPDRVTSLIEQGLPVFKAMGLRDASMLETAAAFASPTLLLDAYAPGSYGGSGEVGDWGLARAAVIRWPDRQIVLAGGLTPETLVRAVRQVHPAAVDVASGVESSPGRKDLGKVRAFIESVRTARDTV